MLALAAAAGSTALNAQPATPIVTWPAPDAIVYGTPLDATQLNATANTPGTFAYAPAAGTILGAGNNQPLSVIFTPDDTVNFTTASASTTLTVLKALPGLTWAPPAAITYGTPLGATQLNATASVPGTFTYTPAAGTILAVGANRLLRVSFTPDDAANYARASASTTIDVDKATPIVTWSTPDAIVYGTPLDATQLNATANTPGTFAYTPAAGTILGAGNNQPLSVTFTPDDTANFTTASASTTLTVLKALPGLTWAPPAAITYGTALGTGQLNATASVPGTFTYTPAAGTILGAGVNRLLRVSFTPDDAANYARASASITIDVNKATPVLTWPAPAAITFGAALGATQLGATANTPGTFTYSPTLGAILGAGINQPLSVTFTPDDTANFTTVTATTTITVNKATPALTWPAPAAITYGTALGAAQLNATASTPGTFVYSPAAGTVLNAGPNQALHVSFTPTDAADFTTASASTTLTVNQAAATIALSDLVQPYDGTPKSVTVTTTPDSLNVVVTYNGSATPPTLPGSYAVVATIQDPNRTATAAGTLVITIAAIVRHAPTLNGDIDGSIQVLLPESTTLNGNAGVSGDLLVPGTPTVRLNGHPTYGSTLDGTGSATPANHTITLNGNALLRHVVRRTDAIAMPVVNAPPAPTGTRNVALNSASQSPAPFATLRNLTLNGNVGQVAVPPGTYGTFIANGHSGFTLGVAGATTPAVYNLQGLTLNGNSALQIVGPVILNLASAVTLNSGGGTSAHPEWLTLNIASGGLTLNGNVTFNGSVVAPTGTITINSSTLNGEIVCDRLTINGNSLLDQRGL